MRYAESQPDFFLNKLEASIFIDIVNRLENEILLKNSPNKRICHLISRIDLK